MEVLVQCSQCLGKLHDIGVVHRDVKPENFLLSRNADYSSVRVVICDFGYSTISGCNKNSTNCGTTSYKAPEIVQNCCDENLEKAVIHAC
jgi:serine/threonine protein kinase